MGVDEMETHCLHPLNYLLTCFADSETPTQWAIHLINIHPPLGRPLIMSQGVKIIVQGVKFQILIVPSGVEYPALIGSLGGYASHLLSGAENCSSEGGVRLFSGIAQYASVTRLSPVFRVRVWLRETRQVCLWSNVSLPFVFRQCNRPPASWRCVSVN